MQTSFIKVSHDQFIIQKNKLNEQDGVWPILYVVNNSV